MTLPAWRGRLRQGSDPAPAPQVRADSAAPLWCRDTQLGPCRRRPRGRPRKRRSQPGLEGAIYRLQENGVTRAVLATHTRLEAPSPLAPRNRALDGRSRKGKGPGPIRAAPPPSPEGSRYFSPRGGQGSHTPPAEITLGSRGRPGDPGLGSQRCESGRRRHRAPLK